MVASASGFCYIICLPIYKIIYFLIVLSIAVLVDQKGRGPRRFRTMFRSVMVVFHSKPVRKEILSESERCEKRSCLPKGGLRFVRNGFRRNERWKENHGSDSEGSEERKKMIYIIKTDRQTPVICDFKVEGVSRQ